MSFELQWKILAFLPLKIKKNREQDAFNITNIINVTTDVTKVMYNVLMNRKMLAEASFLEKIT